MCDYDYDEFLKFVAEIKLEVKGAPSLSPLLPNNLERTFESFKYKYKRRDEAKAALKRMITELLGGGPIELVPIVRPASYFKRSDAAVRAQSDNPEQLPVRRPFAEGCNDVLVGLASQSASPNEDVRNCTPFCLASPLVLRTQHRLPPGTDPYHDAAANLARDAHDLIAGIQTAGPPDSDDNLQWVIRQKEGQRYGRLLVGTFGGPTGPTCDLLVLPAMVRTLCRVLQCPPTHLVVTPYDQTYFYAGSCADPMAMCMLGDITCSAHDRARAPPAFLTRTPFIVKEVSDTGDTPPVVWEKYQCHGTPFGLVGYDLEPQYVVPTSVAAADKLSAGMRQGLAPPLMKLQFTDQCFGCRKAAGVVQLKGCARCRTAVYCSSECQRQDWKQHKVLCQQIRDSGELGTGPAAPTQGKELLTPFTYRL